MKNIWNTLKEKTKSEGRLITALAPMEDVTDTVFRRIVISQGRPDIFFTEFTNCDGLLSKGRQTVLRSLKYEQIEHPIIAQVWGNNSGSYEDAVKTVAKLGFDGIDINMGCPVRKIISSGSCGALIENPALASEIIVSTQKAIGKYARGLPLSIKTRIGFEEIDLGWIAHILKHNVDALTVHVRTVKELSKVPAHWEIFDQIIKLRNEISPNTLIIANGDICKREQIETFGKQYGVDGVMVGRGIFENINIFNSKDITLSKSDRLKLTKDHVNLFVETWEKNKNISILKKYFKIYLRDFDGASSLREKLMNAYKSEEMIDILNRENKDD